jgi:CheY-like chemotaxis protein
VSEVGRGSTFSVYLPEVPAPVADATADTPSASRGGSEVILLAEDEPAVRELARSLLTRSGYTVLAAPTGEEAVRISASHAGPVHLLVTDVIMPGMNGRVLAERLQAERPGLRVLYMTGYTDDAVVRHGVLDATVALLQKPFTHEAMIARVRQLLDAPVSDRPSGQANSPAEADR